MHDPSPQTSEHEESYPTLPHCQVLRPDLILLRCKQPFPLLTSVDAVEDETLRHWQVFHRLAIEQQYDILPDAPGSKKPVPEPNWNGTEMK